MDGTSIPWWNVVWILRILWTAVPQAGYIHPDEFFQSAEVLAGDKFDYEVFRSWEFNSQAPLRSIVLPFALFMPGFEILQYIGWSSDPYALLIVPRSVMTGLSIIVDMLVYKIALMLNLDPAAVLMVYCTSYVSMVYHTRTLSNSIESFLFVALVYCIVNALKTKSERTDRRKRKSKLTRATKESLRVNPSGIEEVWDIQYSTSAIGFILVAGFFNRPTFIIFAFVPCLYWVIGGNTEFINDRFAMFAIIKKSMHLTFIMTPMVWFFIVCDSLYYVDFNEATLDDKGLLYAIAEFIVMTPLNFLGYNSQSSNLAKHTLHPRYLHALVNTQLLFGFLGIFAVLAFLQLLLIKRSLFKNKDVTWRGFLILSYVVPIMILSIFPHQEPRFLLPLLLPVSLLFGHRIFGIISNGKLTYIWITFNLVCGLFYGCFHQGGLIPAIATLKEQMPDNDPMYDPQLNPPPKQFIIFYNTYMPPRYLFASPKQLKSNLKIHDLKGAEPDALFKLLHQIKYYSNEPYQIFLVSPRTSEFKFCGDKDHRINFYLQHQFVGHVSMENIPPYNELYQMIWGGYCCTLCEDRSQCQDTSTFSRLQSMFSLNLYQVHVP